MASRGMRRATLGLAVAALRSGDAAAKDSRGLGCTAMAVDGRASVDGSAFAGMNADCAACDPRVAWVPGGDHERGARRPIYAYSGTAPRYMGYGRGAFYEPKMPRDADVENGGRREHLEAKRIPHTGSIPEAPKTFGYWEGALPMMNEVGLTMGESSCAARLMNYPLGKAPVGGDPRFGRPATEALIDLANLMQIAMERCETARCGVETMGNLSDEYGFYPMVGEWSLGMEPDGKVAFDDGGEAVTLADRKGEAWVFHVVGGVPGVAKSAWVAMRLPAGHAAFVANNFILRSVPEAPNDDWLFSPKLREVARASGLWSGQEPLDFTRVFAPDAVKFQSPPGEAPIPLYASLRLWRLASLAAPQAFRDTPLPVDPLRFVSTTKVERPLRHEDVFRFLSDLYEGTEFDLSQGVLAGPFGNPFRVEGGSATATLGQIPRGIAIARTSYSVIGQSRPSGEPVMWFAADTPATSVYVPFYAAVGGHRAQAYAEGTLLEFSRKSAFWAFDFVSNWASLVHWRHASAHHVLPLRAKLQEELGREMRIVEAKAEKDGRHVLAEWQVDAQQRVVDRWWQLADDLVVAYNDGFLNNASTGELGRHLGYPEWYARQIGFDQDIHPIFVKRDRAAQEDFVSEPGLRPPGWRAPESDLPGGYSFASAQWLYDAGGGAGAASPRGGASLASRTPGRPWEAAPQIGVGAAILGVGVLLGRVWERRSACGGRGRTAMGLEPLL